MRRRVRAGALAALALLVSGCLGVPDEGPVVEVQAEVDPNEELGYYNDPAPPSPGEQPADIVQGFLNAQTAIPVQTNTAEQFLTRAAASSWRPQQATITYADASLPEGSNRVSVELTGANRLDAGGSWRGPVPAEERSLDFTMQREDGEWRIADLPDARVVPETWFSQVFRRVSLYFLDPSGRITVPEPVFLPRGDALPTALVKGLIQGPAARLTGVARSFVPPDLDVGLDVPVSDSGVAHVAFTGSGALPGEREAALLVAQLAWTLSQDSALTGFRVSVNGDPVVLAEGRLVFPMDRGRYFDPSGVQSTAQVFALREGRLVTGEPDDLDPAGGRLGSRTLGVDAVSADLSGTRVAAVTTAGDRVLLTDVRDPEAPVPTVFSGTGLLPPAWDFADRMWVVDRPAGGARVWVRERGRVRAVRVRGISGERVARMVVSRDGSRLVALVDRGSDDRLVMARLRYDRRGRVAGATPARTITWTDQSRVDVLDIGWASPTSLTVLHRLSGDLVQLESLPVDGAPPERDSISVTLQGSARGVVSSPRATDTVLVTSAQGLLDALGSSEAALPGTENLRSATYVG